jgi:hypothetical protein
MNASKLMPGDKVKVVGGSYVSHTTVIIKVTKHMYQIRLSALARHVEEIDVVCMMLWNVEKVEDPTP